MGRDGTRLVEYNECGTYLAHCVLFLSFSFITLVGLLRPGIELDSNGVPKDRALSAEMWNNMANRFTQSQQASAA